MKFTLVSFVALLAGTAMAAALPAPEAAPEAAAVLEARGKKDPSLPDPPKGKFSSVSQSCRGSQSSIRCCTSSQSNSQSSSKPKKVKFQNLEVAANCDQDISNADHNQLTANICSVTVACCIGDGCVAIAN